MVSHAAQFVRIDLQTTYKSTILDGYRHASSDQGGLDMGRHVIRAFRHRASVLHLKVFLYQKSHTLSIVPVECLSFWPFVRYNPVKCITHIRTDILNQSTHLNYTCSCANGTYLIPILIQT